MSVREMDIQFVETVARLGHQLTVLSDIMRFLGSKLPDDVEDGYDDADRLDDIGDVIEGISDTISELIVDMVNVQRMANLLKFHNMEIEKNMGNKIDPFDTEETDGPGPELNTN